MANKPTQPLFPLGLETSESSNIKGFNNSGTIEHSPGAVMTFPEDTEVTGLPSSVRYNPDSDEFEGYYENGGWLSLGGGGIRWETLPHAPSSNLLEGRGYLINNTTGTSTVVLPSPTRIGDSVTICDAYGKFATYPLTVSPSGNNLYGSTEDMAITTDNVSATFTWSGPEQGWVITSGVGLGQGRVYSREIFTQILASETSAVTLNTPPTIVDVYADGKRLAESKYSLDGNVITFSPSLPANTELQVIEYTPIQLGNGGGSGSSTITWVYNGGSAIGGETEITLDIVVDDVPAIDINGSRQYKNMGFTFDPLTSKITLAQELDAEDEVVVIINGTPNIYNQIDYTLREVARVTNVKDTEVVYFSVGAVLSGYKVIYDKVTQRSYFIPELPTGTTAVSLSSSAVLVHSAGSVDLGALAVSREEYITLSGTFDSGAVINTKNELLTHTDGKYRWDGALPKTVDAGSTPASTGGIGVGKWLSVGDAALRTNLASYNGFSLIGVCPDVITLRTLSVPIGKKVLLLGYHSDHPGTGGGTLYASSDTSLADDGVRVFVTSDGTRLVRETNGELYASWAGAVGDWNGTTGTDNKEAIERLITASGTEFKWVIDLTNIGVSSVVIDNKNNWNGHINGSVINISAKPAAGAVDRKDQDGGLLPTIKITNSDGWKLTGSFVDNRYREAFYVEYCDNFELGCANLGSGINNNLAANHFRYCNHFKLNGWKVEKSGVIPLAGYYDWVQAIRMWDCSGFIIDGLTSHMNAGNGIYIASNCKDYVVTNFDITENAMSGIQLAWSGFGVMPIRGVISNGTITGNRADSIDVNNTSGIKARLDLIISGVINANNGYNSDGTVTADGSGLGTFINVSHFIVDECSSTSPARSGVAISNCSNFRVKGIIKKDQPSNSDGHGVYIENSADGEIDVDCITDSANANMYSIRTYGALENIHLSGKYVGYTLFGDDATYVNCSLDKASIISPTTVANRFPWENVNVVVSGSNAVDIKSTVNSCRFVSNNGHGGVLSSGNNDISDSEFYGTDGGLYCADNIGQVRVRGGVAQGGSAAGLRISGGEKHIIEGLTTKSTSGNSCVITNASKVIYIGNDDSANPTNFTGTTFTLQN
ncbi:haemolysin-type calcium binding [Salmonella phage Se-G]|uniref:haemolysin-type calcium binding n=1 Tax=Salmonella phage Se-G TaxID=2698907 RepID=UPI0018AFB14B|nr:haemolysin-type calcium binding [Salmonella phage Se-G]